MCFIHKHVKSKAVTCVFLVLLSLCSRVSLVMVESSESKPLGNVKHILQAFLLPSKQHQSIEGMKGEFCRNKVLQPAYPC